MVGASCESPHPVQQPSGCCADGRKCDEICIAIAAAERCREEACDSNRLESSAKCPDACCGGQTDEPASACSLLNDQAESDKDLARSQEDGTCQQGCCGEVPGKQAKNGASIGGGSCAKEDGCCAPIAGSTKSENGEDCSVMSCQSACCAGEEQTSTHGSDAEETKKDEHSCCAKMEQCTSISNRVESDVLSQPKSFHQESTKCDSGTMGANNCSTQDCCSSKIGSDKAAQEAVDCLANKKQSCKSITPPISIDKKGCSCCDVNSISSSHATSSDRAMVADFKEACSAHLEQAIRKYSAYLNAGLCICRSALTRPGTCCDERKRAAVTRKRKIGSDISLPTLGPVSKRRMSSQSTPTVAQRCKQSCCSEKLGITTVEAVDVRKDEGKCAKADSFLEGKGKSAVREDSCCKQRARLALHETCFEPSGGRFQKEPTARVRPDDIEQNAAREHVLFSISGMTCAGCVKKVVGVLGHVDGVENVKVNFVAALGDADIDTSRIDVKVVLDRLEKETGFKCSRIVRDHQILDVFMNESQARSFSNNTINGIESLEKLGKAYRITFDPTLIGAREVLRRSRGDLAPPSTEEAMAGGRQIFLFKLWSFLTAAILTIPVVVLAWGDTGVAYKIRSIISLVMATFVQAIAVPEFYTPALKALVFSKSVEMDMLVVISITAAYGYSVVAFGLTHAGIKLEQEEFFETSTLLITLVLLGRLVSSYAKVKAVQAVSMRSLQADTAYLQDEAGHTIEVDARLLEFNDTIVIPPHSKVVSDGYVVRGESAIDESMLTGETLPVRKVTGDSVVAGTLNGPGPLHVRLTRLPGQNSITDIANLVQNAIKAKPRVQDLADVVAGWFVPVVLGISTIVFVIWLVIGLRLRKENAGGAIGLSITYGIAVLAISCPCALGLAVPLVLVIAGGVAARAGVIIKEADAVERGFKVTDVVFDKTGTLTTGELDVVDEHLHDQDNNVTKVQAYSVAHALIKDNDHPVSRAVAKRLRSYSAETISLESIKSVPGAGVEAVWKESVVQAGNPFWLDIASLPPITDSLANGSTLLCISVDGRPVISFSLQSTIRAEAQSVINHLHTRGISCHIVSGDQPTTVSHIAATLNIPDTRAAARQSPAAKQAYIQHLTSAGKTTLFVGDGTNDAVAIAQAHVGVQIGPSASDISRATSDVVLLGGLDGVLTLLDVSRQAYYRIIFNFAWSVAYNVFAILLAAGAFVNFRIPPSYAGLGEIVSVLPVVLAALSLTKIKTRTGGGDGVRTE